MFACLFATTFGIGLTSMPSLSVSVEENAKDGSAENISSNAEDVVVIKDQWITDWIEDENHTESYVFENCVIDVEALFNRNVWGPH